MVELLCSRHPQAGYERRALYTHRSRLTGVLQCYILLENRNICLPIYNSTIWKDCQAPFRDLFAVIQPWSTKSHRRSKRLAFISIA